MRVFNVGDIITSEDRDLDIMANNLTDAGYDFIIYESDCIEWSHELQITQTPQ